MADAAALLQEVLGGGGFSFVYGGRASRDLLPAWRLTRRRRREKDGVVRHALSYSDPKTGLVVVVEVKEYTRFPVVEWGLRLRNASKRRSPMLDSIRSLDATLNLGKLPYLHHYTGDYYAIDGYEPFRVSLAHEEGYAFAPVGGRPTNRAWPYYNLECPAESRGAIVVVGWSGQWASSFQGLRDGNVHVTAGQETTHFRLLPGEEVRTPLSVLLFYRGDSVRGQNLWRRWMIEHNLPRPGGKLPEPILPAYTGRWFDEMGTATEDNQIAFIERYRQEGIRLDYWWMDAGWYPCFHDGKNRWPRTGTWEPDPQRFPRGLRAICDHAHAKGIKTLVWFEPERVVPESWLGRRHAEWLLKEVIDRDGSRKKVDWSWALNLGDPAALRWLISHTSKVIREQAIDLYRQDHNFDPLPFWRANDGPDRQGITENRHVRGYLTFWKALRKRFPNMLIDSCASGGRRNDLETMRLSVPLHKTDYNYADNATKQAFHHTLSSWLPYYGAYVLPVETVDTYAFRSSLAPMTMLTYDLRRRDIDWAPLRQLCEQWRRLVATGYFYGDYYPMTPYNRDETRWIAWQHHRTDNEAGLVQAFRRKDCVVQSVTLRLRGLDADAKYRLTDLDAPQDAKVLTGRELMDAGLAVEAAQAPQAVLVTYERVHDR